MVALVWLIVLVALVAPAQAQTYSRCVEPGGAVYLTDGPLPAAVHCVAHAMKELRETPPPVERVAAVAPGQHGLWITESSGAILARMYQSEEACRASRDARLAVAAQRSQLDVAYRCLPAGAKP